MPRDVKEGSDKWMYIVIPVAVLFLVVMFGLYLWPLYSKANTEKDQLVELREQNKLLVRIAEAIERCTKQAQ